ncbi:glycosyltransferase family 39 protein [Candidatus Micrarchaeota archaeon]|nr:glycosyltransferase family 39 protein [Candidatus Micrarchaeota archaeon]
MALDQRYYWWAAAAILLLGIGLRFDLTLLPMTDEVLYAVLSMENQHRGFAGDANAEHPPLAKWFLGLPTHGIPFDMSEFSRLDKTYSTLPPVPFVESLAPRILPSIRAVSLIFSVLLALAVFLFAKRWLGLEGGLVAFFVMMFSPSLSLFSNAVMLDMVFLFFFTTCILFYLFEYSGKRDWPRRIVLAILLFAAMSAKFNGFYALGVILLFEVIRFIKTKEVDDWLLISVWITAAAFLAVSYPLFKVMWAFQHYVSGSVSLNADLLLVTLARIELLVFFLVGLAVFFFWKHGKRDGHAVSLFVLVGLFFVSVIFNPWPHFRYSLILWPFLALLAGWGFIHANGLQRKLALAFGVLMLVNAFYYYPYYDSYVNPLGRIIQTPPVERSPVLGVHAFLSNVPEPIATDDPYHLPFSFQYNATFWWRYAWENGQLEVSDVIAFGQPICFHHPRLTQYLWDSGAVYFVRRTDGLQEPRNCDGLYSLLDQLNVVYQDANFRVYTLR